MADRVIGGRATPAKPIAIEVDLTGVLFTPASAKVIDREVEPGLRLAGEVTVAAVAKLVYQRARNTGLFGQSVTSLLVRPAPGVWAANVFSPLTYADPIEVGRRRGARQPPSGPIELWARRKLGLSATQAKRAAFVIARSIGRKGIPAKWVFRDGAAAAAPVVRRIFDGVAARIAKALA